MSLGGKTPQTTRLVKKLIELDVRRITQQDFTSLSLATNQIYHRVVQESATMTAGELSVEQLVGRYRGEELVGDANTQIQVRMILLDRTLSAITEWRTNPANPATIEQNASNRYTTPEAALGLSSGSLDQYKTSTPPSLPMSGIVYYTGDLWNAPDFGDEDNPSTGILIVHNSGSTATLKNMHGYFKGLIIADDLVHINGDAVVIGGIILQKSTGNTVGNGSAEVKFSSSVLQNLPAANYQIVSWEDAKGTTPYTYS